MLELTEVSKVFGGVAAVDGVSMHVQEGEVQGLIGPNGAGKTTLINLISGFLKSDGGAIRLEGTRLDGLPAHRRASMGLARTFQNLRIFSNLSVEQNIQVAAISGARSKGSAYGGIDEALERFDLKDKRRLPAAELSYGHMRRLEIVRALALAPKVLLLDEPAAGMNEKESSELVEGLRWINRNFSCSILVIDHDLKFIMSVCDRITVLSMGRILAIGTPESIAREQLVIEAYLGRPRAADA